MDNIPEELVDDIATLVSSGGLYNWLRASKRYYRIVIPHLYKDLVLEKVPKGDDTKLLALSKTLKNTPSWLDKIRTCDVEFPYNEASKDMHAIITSAPNLEKFCARFQQRQLFNYDSWVQQRKRKQTMPKLDWIIPRAYEFMNLKSIELYYPYTTIHRMSPIFRLPSLETFKIHGALSERDIYSDELPAWKDIASTIKHLHMIGFTYLTWNGYPQGDWIGQPIRQIIKCCPHLETFQLSGVEGVRYPPWTAQQVLECLQDRRLRKLFLFDLPFFPTRRRRNLSYHRYLMCHNLEELEIDGSLYRDTFFNDAVLLPSTLQVLRLWNRRHPMTEANLKKTKATTVKRELPALNCIVLREGIPYYYTAEQDVENLVASYKAAGILFTREFFKSTR